MSNVRLVGILSPRDLEGKAWNLVFHALIEVGLCKGKSLVTSLESAFVAFLNDRDIPLTSHSEFPNHRSFVLNIMVIEGEKP